MMTATARHVAVVKNYMTLIPTRRSHCLTMLLQATRITIARAYFHLSVMDYMSPFLTSKLILLSFAGLKKVEWLTGLKFDSPSTHSDTG